jgi:hypothetical protein
LLLDSHRGAEHVDAEVPVHGRWIVVDAAFRAILRGADGSALTRDQRRQLCFPPQSKIFPSTISYSFERTAHVRIARLGFLGTPIRKVLDFLLPRWQDWSAISLMMEREALAAMIVAITLLVFLIAVRFSLRWYGEKHLRVYSVHIREQLRRAYHAFLNVPS